MKISKAKYKLPQPKMFDLILKKILPIIIIMSSYFARNLDLLDLMHNFPC